MPKNTKGKTVAYKRQKSNSHKTAKRLAIKKAMLEAKAKRPSKPAHLKKKSAKK